jgi:hypothetical protein
LIAECYNYAAYTVNKRAATKVELNKARKALVDALAIIDTSKNEEIRMLKENCRSGIAVIDKRIGSK